MRLKLLRPVVVKGHPEAKIGDIIEVTGGDAGLLIGMEAAVECKDAPAPIVAPEAIQTREPEVENRDPKPVKRSKGKLP